MITNAYIKEIAPQVDGRRYITEIQADDVQGEMQFIYLAEPDDDITTIMNRRMYEINENLTDNQENNG